MTKTEATSLLGGSTNAAAEAIGITIQAFSQWPEELSDKLRDRVQAALWRKSQGAGAREDSSAARAAA